MTSEITLEDVRRRILELPEETIRGFTADEFEDITATVFRDLGCEVDYKPGSLRFRDVILNGVQGVECKKSLRYCYLMGSMVSSTKKVTDLIEVWIFYLNQKACDISSGVRVRR